MQAHEYMAKLFAKYNVSHVFYQEAILRVFMREIEKDPNAVTKFILAHSEQAAGYMADGYARATGRPGVCMCQSIGAGNMVGAIYDAFLANSPIVCVTGKKDTKYQYKNAYQETDHRLLYEGITKFNGEVVDGEQIPFLFRNCFQHATTGKARPTHLDFPDHQGHKMEIAEVSEPFNCNPQFSVYPAVRSAAPIEAVEKAAEAIRKAQKPLIIAGRGATMSRAKKELLEFAEKGDIPVVESPDGKTLIDETHPLWSGIVGNYGMDCANRAAVNADLCIFLGTQASDQTTLDWTCPPPSTKCIQIDVDPTELGKNYVDTIGLCGDVRTVLEQLIAAIPSMEHKDWRKEVAGYVKATLDENKALQESETTPILPARLCEEISKNLPDDAVLVSDTGYSAVWSATMIRMKSSQDYYRAAGSLGWGYPASLGVKCGVGDRPVFCFAGDGAMYYHLPEMETAARYGIKTITIINNNNALAQSASGLTKVHKDTPDHGASHFRFTAPSFTELAKTFGLNAILVTDASEIGPAIQKALKADKGTVIEVITETMSFTPPAYKG